MSVLIDIVSGVLLLAGGFFLIAGAVGMVRMPDMFTRLHAASLTDTGGASLILIGLMLQSGWTLVTVKLAFILLFILFTSPTAGYALARAALHAGLKPR